MATTREYLKRNGWRRHSAKRMGCVKIVYWYDPVNHEIIQQAPAVLTQRQRNKARRLNCKRVGSDYVG